jgi:CRISPR/Cas system-associated endonuclease Cas3-HD
MNEKSNIKSLIAGAAITLIITLVGAYFAFYISRSNVDLRYTFSERIIINTQGESVQQLEIKNLGNALADKIIVNIIGDIKSYSITKNVENDKVQEFSKPDGLQIVYPELPPQSSIKIALTSTGREGSQVSIRHSKGVASEALSSSSSGVTGTVATILLLSTVGVYIWLNIKNLLVSIWTQRVIDKHGLEKVLKRSSTPVLLKKEWKDIRELALQQASVEIIDKADEPFSPVAYKNCYKFLEEKLFANCVFSIEEKMKLEKSAQESVKLLIHMQCNKIYNLSEFKDLLKLDRPKLFLKENWSGLRSDIITFYCREIIRKDSLFTKINKIDDCEAIKALSSNLDFLDEEERTEFKKTVKESFLITLKQEILNLQSYGQKDIEAFSQTPKPPFILQHEWDEVMSIARQKFVLLNLQKLSSWNISKKECEEIFALVIPHNLQGKEWYELVALIEKYYSVFAFEEFLKTFSKEKIIESFQPNHIYNWNAIKEKIKAIEDSCYIQKAIRSTPKDLCDIMKPEGINEQLAESIEKYIKEKDLLTEELANASKERIQFTSLKEKVLAQMEFINTVLEAPLSVDRVEDYEDIFSKGNYENLKKVSEILKTNCQQIA